MEVIFTHRDFKVKVFFFKHMLEENDRIRVDNTKSHFLKHIET
jgi:hypothetical protein